MEDGRPVPAHDGAERPTKRPWWDVAQTARRGFVLGGLWLSLGVLQTLVAVTAPEVKAWRYVVAAAWLVLGAWYVVVGIMHQRRD